MEESKLMEYADRIKKGINDYYFTGLFDDVKSFKTFVSIILHIYYNKDEYGFNDIDSIDFDEFELRNIFNYYNYNVNSENKFNDLLDGIDLLIDFFDMSNQSQYLLNDILFKIDSSFDLDVDFKSDRFDELLHKLLDKYLSLEREFPVDNNERMLFRGVSTLFKNKSLLADLYSKYVDSFSIYTKYADNNEEEDNSIDLYDMLLGTYTVSNDEEYDAFIKAIDNEKLNTLLFDHSFYEPIKKMFSDEKYKDKFCKFLIDHANTSNVDYMLDNYFDLAFNRDEEKIFDYLDEIYKKCFSNSLDTNTYRSGNMSVFLRTYYDQLDRINLDSTKKNELLRKFTDFYIQDNTDTEYYLDTGRELQAFLRWSNSKYDLDTVKHLADSYYSNFIVKERVSDLLTRIKNDWSFIGIEDFARHLNTFDEKYEFLKYAIKEFSLYNETIGDKKYLNPKEFDNNFILAFIDLEREDELLEQISILYNDPDINIDLGSFLDTISFNFVGGLSYDFCKNLVKKLNISIEKDADEFIKVNELFIYNEFYSDIDILDFIKELYAHSNLIEDFPKYHQDIISIIIGKIKDKELLVDYDIMKDIYSIDFLTSKDTLNPDIEYPFSISSLYLGHFLDEHSLGEEETIYLKNNMLKELLYKYKNVGVISDVKLNELYRYTCNYIKGLTYSDFINRIVANKNIKRIFDKAYDNEVLFEKFKLLFPKVRFSEMLDVDIVDAMSIDMCQKFHLKTWKKLMANPLLSCDVDTKKSVINIIEFAGLFENDPEVNIRRKKIYELFDIYNLSFSESEIHVNLSDYLKLFYEVDEPIYNLRNNVVVDESIEHLFHENMSENEIRRLLRREGNIGSIINKFLYPYNKEGDFWYIKRGIDVRPYRKYLKEVMSDKEMQEVLDNPNTPDYILNFLNPLKKDTVKRYKIRKDIKDTGDISLLFAVNSIMDASDINTIFNTLSSYSKEKFDFFIENFDQIVKSFESKDAFNQVMRNFDAIKQYFIKRGNNNPDYNDMVTFLKSPSYLIEFGNEEFAEDVKNNNVSKEGFDFYQDLLRKTRERKLSTIPRQKGVYNIEVNGKIYTIKTKVLRSDDPFNLLVGENNFTGCCQRYHGVGESCMIHASTSQNGAIFATYLVIGDEETLLTQSWTWTNESKLCFDNVEATYAYKSNPNMKDLEQAVLDAIYYASKEMIKASEKEVLEYYLKELDRIKSSDLSNEEKIKKIEELDEFRKRQVLKTITVGSGYSDIDIEKRFKELDNDTTTETPKDAEDVTYSDAKLGQQYIVTQKEGKIKSSSKFKEKAIYRDEREVKEESSKISSFTLKKISDIDEDVNKGKAKYKYGKTYSITNTKELSDFYETDEEHIRAITGEDWYLIYYIQDDYIRICDIAKNSPRFEDEKTKQATEIMNILSQLLRMSVVLDESGNVIKTKEISACFEDEEIYSLYLSLLEREYVVEFNKGLNHDVIFKISSKGIKELYNMEEGRGIK